ncbi:MAG: YihY/virulence factor BrkB family protein [bacterium]|nr:YihY/virulence factor BrkB family protein [bacterium]
MLFKDLIMFHKFIDKLEQKTRRIVAILYLAAKKYEQIDGAQRAGAFAFDAFFALFPLIILFVTVASVFIDRDTAGKTVIAYVEHYVPIKGEMQRYIFDTAGGVVKTRGPAGVVAFLMLVWAAIQFFTIVITTTNRAWGIKDHNWWRLPLKSLILLGISSIAIVVGIAMPILTMMVRGWLFSAPAILSWLYGWGSLIVPLLVVFLGLSIFYQLAPRRLMRFAEVWAAALCATVLLWASQSLFVIYLKSFAMLNAIYGAFGGIMALLLWIYLSGIIFIFGACLCAAQSETISLTAHPREQT